MELVPIDVIVVENNKFSPIHPTIPRAGKH